VIVRVSPRANDDLRRLYNWLGARHPTAASRAMDAIAAGLRLLETLPERGREIGGKTREIHIKFGREGYVARYEVRDEEVMITRIFHGRELRP